MVIDPCIVEGRYRPFELFHNSVDLLTVHEFCDHAYKAISKKGPLVNNDELIRSLISTYHKADRLMVLFLKYQISQEAFIKAIELFIKQVIAERGLLN